MIITKKERCTICNGHTTDIDQVTFITFNELDTDDNECTVSTNITHQTEKCPFDISVKINDVRIVYIESDGTESVFVAYRCMENKQHLFIDKHNIEPTKKIMNNMRNICGQKNLYIHLHGRCRRWKKIKHQHKD